MGLCAGPCASAGPVPRCPGCGALLRPDVVWFGEPLAVEAIDAAWNAVDRCELLFAVGASLEVEPAAGFTVLTGETGAGKSILVDALQLALGSRGVVVEIKVAPERRSRLLEMGLLVGTPVELVRFAPLGDPLELRVGNTRLSLRRADAAGVVVSKL